MDYTLQSVDYTNFDAFNPHFEMLILQSVDYTFQTV